MDPRGYKEQSKHVQLYIKSRSHIDLLFHNLAQIGKIESARPSAIVSISESFVKSCI